MGRMRVRIMASAAEWPILGRIEEAWRWERSVEDQNMGVVKVVGRTERYGWAVMLAWVQWVTGEGEAHTFHGEFGSRYSRMRIRMSSVQESCDLLSSSFWAPKSLPASSWLKSDGS